MHGEVRIGNARSGTVSATPDGRTFAGAGVGLGLEADETCGRVPEVVAVARGSAVVPPEEQAVASASTSPPAIAIRGRLIRG
ncbi:hypothetical protein GCM10009741_51870 [Kribbella lupini]|uniref:Uncharacterized protein n=1 Tax=Kribbella lupini TaxID=291602 RepID=A0ABN2BJC0_9ACTN